MSAKSHSLGTLIGARIRLAREAKGWTQAQLAEALGIADRQTITSIEIGDRKVAPEEMRILIRELEQPLEFFTDPHRVVEENAFSYRARRETADFAAFERQARKLIETHRRLRPLLDEAAPPMFNGLRGITKTTPLETVGMFGFRFSMNWELGPRPALKLREAIERRHNVLVLDVDAPDGISGAACHLDDGDVSSSIAASRPIVATTLSGTNFFTCSPGPICRRRLATSKRSRARNPRWNNLPMPSPPTCLCRTRSYVKSGGTLRERVLHVARHFDVSGQAVYWRLVSDRYLNRAEADALASDSLSRTAETESAALPSFPFDRSFVQRVHRALKQGRLTVNYAAEMLEYDRSDLADLFTVYGLNDPTVD